VVRWRETPGRIVVFAAISPDGAISSAAGPWLARTAALPHEWGRWRAWLRGEAALRDKRGVWIEFDWQGDATGAAQEISRLLQGWGQLAPKLVSYGPPPP
jgi:hypothetical protein